MKLKKELRAHFSLVKKQQFKHNWGISFERAAFTPLDCLVVSAFILSYILYVRVLSTGIHSRFFFQFQFHRKRSNLLNVKESIFPLLSLLVRFLFNSTSAAYSHLLHETFPRAFHLFNSSSSFFYGIHYQLENADECVTMRSKWARHTQPLSIVLHCNYAIKGIFSMPACDCETLARIFLLFKMYSVVLHPLKHNNVINF